MDVDLGFDVMGTGMRRKHSASGDGHATHLYAGELPSSWTAAWTARMLSRILFSRIGTVPVVSAGLGKSQKEGVACRNWCRDDIARRSDKRNSGV